MVPRMVADAGYTAVGLGVLGLNRLNIGRREAFARLDAVAGIGGRLARDGCRHLCALRPGG